MKFYELAPKKRRKMLQKQGIKLDEIDPQVLRDLDLLSENVIGQLRLPVGLVQNLLVNGQNYQVPMVTEEASVVAAANNGAGIVAKAGGFTASSQRDGIWGQIVMQVAENFKVSNLQEVLPALIKKTNTYFASLVSHGGGVRKIELKQINDLLYIKVLVDPAEAMGANKVNSILEFMADELEDFAGIKQNFVKLS